MSEKQGSGIGDWIYIRDGSSMTQLLASEMGIVVGKTGGEGTE